MELLKPLSTAALATVLVLTNLSPAEAGFYPDASKEGQSAGIKPPVYSPRGEKPTEIESTEPQLLSVIPFLDEEEGEVYYMDCLDAYQVAFGSHTREAQTLYRKGAFYCINPRIKVTPFTPQP